MTLSTGCLLLILGSPLLAAAALVLSGARARRAAGWLAAGASGISLAATFALLPVLQRDMVPAWSSAWIPDAGIGLGLTLDWLSFPFSVTVGAVTLLAIVYAWGSQPTDERTPLFHALLLLFSVGMQGAVLASTLLLFYVFWELMLIASAALIAGWGSGEQRTAVATKYFIITHLGSLLVLVGLLELYHAAGSDSFSALQRPLALGPALTSFVIALLIVGFAVKMAIVPLHIWLPDAHAVAPMPVTIMLAAAMLSMGSYGILRFPLGIFSPSEMHPFAVPMMVAGIVSEIYGALMVLAERDVKRIIAYSSVSQMGYILFGLGTLTHDGVEGSILHVVFHAIVKALLFMVVGLVVHATGRRRIDELGGLGREMRFVTLAAAVGILAIAGTPPLCIFDSEWMIFSGGFSSEHLLLAIAALLGSLLTVIYALWFVARVFMGPRPDGLRIERPPWAMVAPTALLVLLTLLTGLLPSQVFYWAEHALASILGGI